MGHVPFSLRRPRSRLSTLLVLSVVSTLALAGTANATPDGTTKPASIALAAVPGSSCTFQGVARSACITFAGFFGESPTGGTEVFQPLLCSPTTNVGHAVNCEELDLVNDVATGVTRAYTVEIRYNPQTSIQDLGIWTASGVLIAEGLGDTSCIVPGTDTDPTVTPEFEPGCARVTFDVTGGSGDFIVTVSAFFFACPPGLPDLTNPLATCPNEPFDGIVTTQAPSSGTGGDNGGVVPPDPPVSISDARLVEGDAATTSATFTVTMGWTSDVPVTVNYLTADEDATAGSDYLPATGSVVFLPGELVHQITVPVLGETVREPRETFHVYLLLPEPARVGTIGDGDGVGTIVNDDWGRRMSGSGSVLGTAKNSFAVRLAEFASWNTVRYYQGSAFSFRSRRIESISFDELTRSVRVSGTGWNGAQSVTFTLEAIDRGDPGTLDVFILVLSDGSRADGTLQSGNLKYTG